MFQNDNFKLKHRRRSLQVYGAFRGIGPGLIEFRVKQLISKVTVLLCFLLFADLRDINRRLSYVISTFKIVTGFYRIVLKGLETVSNYNWNSYATARH